MKAHEYMTAKFWANEDCDQCGGRGVVPEMLTAPYGDGIAVDRYEVVCDCAAAWIADVQGVAAAKLEDIESKDGEELTAWEADPETERALNALVSLRLE